MARRRDLETHSQDYGFREYDSQDARFWRCRSVSFSIPFYSPYMFAGNMPIYAIDLDGLEPVKGDKNYGKYLFFGSKDQFTILNPTIRDKNNENWLGFRSRTLYETRLQLENFKGTVETVYIQSHGSSGGLHVIPTDKAPDIAFPELYDSGEYLTGGDIEAFMKNEG